MFSKAVFKRTLLKARFPKELVKLGGEIFYNSGCRCACIVLENLSPASLESWTKQSKLSIKICCTELQSVLVFYCI